jgi:hypothetical protein
VWFTQIYSNLLKFTQIYSNLLKFLLRFPTACHLLNLHPVVGTCMCLETPKVYVCAKVSLFCPLYVPMCVPMCAYIRCLY